jgi:hypothetical protein
MYKLSFLSCIAVAMSVFLPTLLPAQAANAPSASARLLVTVEALHGKDVPEVTRPDVIVFEGRDRDEVSNWVPAQGDNAALELFILLDDGSTASLGSQLNELRQFINSQPESTKVGVAYMQNGIAKVQQGLTADHNAAAQSLRLPLGERGINGSPYFSLTDLIKHWPQTSARREVLMITDGIDPYYGGWDPQDPYLSAAIGDAQRAGVVVFGIYTPGVGHFDHSFGRTYWGQMYLSRLAGETGGESYYIGFNGPPVSFDPYLGDMAAHLAHQYFLTFIPKPQKSSGWRSIRLKTEVPNADLVSADKVYVVGINP